MCLTIANEKCIVCVGQFSDCGGCIHHSILFNIQTFTANPFYRSFQKPVPQANSQTSSCYGFLQFRLNVPDLQDIAEESRRVLGDVPHKALAATPFCVELSLRTPEGESMVLEIWELCKYLIWVENYCGNHTYTVVFKLWNSKYIYLYLYIFLLQMLLLSSFFMGSGNVKHYYRRSSHRSRYMTVTIEWLFYWKVFWPSLVSFPHSNLHRTRQWIPSSCIINYTLALCMWVQAIWVHSWLICIWTFIEIWNKIIYMRETSC